MKKKIVEIAFLFIFLLACSSSFISLIFVRVFSKSGAIFTLRV